MFTSDHLIVGAGIAALTIAISPSIEELADQASKSPDWEQRHITARACYFFSIPGTLFQAIVLTPCMFAIGGTLCLFNGRCKQLHLPILKSLQERSECIANIHLLFLKCLNPQAKYAWNNSSLTSRLVNFANHLFDKLDKNSSWMIKKVIRRSAYTLFAASLVMTSVPSIVMGVVAGALSLLAGTLSIVTGSSHSNLHGFAYQELRDTFKFNALVFCAMKFKDPDAPLKLTYTTANGISIEGDELILPEDTSDDEPGLP